MRCDLCGEFRDTGSVYGVACDHREVIVTVCTECDAEFHLSLWAGEASGV